jgi:hypothetical protein
MNILKVVDSNDSDVLDFIITNATQEQVEKVIELVKELDHAEYKLYQVVDILRTLSFEAYLTNISKVVEF